MMPEWITSLWFRMKALTKRKQLDRDLEDEVAFHLAMREASNRDAGIASEEAGYAARRQFGNTTQVKERTHDMWTFASLETLWQDIRFGVRVLRKNPGFAAIAVLTMALGIGANAAIFSITYGVLLRPLPFPEADRIVELARSFRGEREQMSVTAANLRMLRESTQIFEHLGGFSDEGYTVSAGENAERVRGMPISADFFPVFGVQPALGRNILPEEDLGAGKRVAIISHGLWMRKFGGNPGTVGKSISLNGEPYTLIGVMPANFDAMASTFDSGPKFDVWTPLAIISATAGSGSNIGVIARLKPGVTRAQVDAEMEHVTQQFLKEADANATAEQHASFHVLFLPYQFMIGMYIRPYLVVLLGAIGFVLLIACANVASLLLAKGTSRSREIAVRLALGASKRRLFRQLLTESLLIAFAGGALGLLIARIALDSLLAMAPIELPRVHDVHLDVWAVGFTFLISSLTGVLFGIAPALSAAKNDVNKTLNESAGRSSAGCGRARIRKGLIVGELALSVVLLMGAGLMIATFEKLMNTDPGFDAHHVLTLEFWLTGSKYRSTTDVASFYRTLETKIKEQPGVERVGIVAAGLPLERGGKNGVRIVGAKQTEWLSVNYREASVGYFPAVGIAIRRGRGILETDTDTSPRVVVINEAFQKSYLQGNEGLGQHVLIGEKSYEVVGVAGDVKSFLDMPTPPATFIPAAQADYEDSKLFEGWFPRSIAVRTNGNPLLLSRALKEAVASVDPLVPTGAMLSMDQRLANSLALRRFMMLLLSIFAGLALVLASVGMYGVISYAVSQRTQEIGVRMALGAQPRNILQMVLREGLRLVVIGVILGIAAALMLTKLLESMVYGVSGKDPLVLALVSALLMAVALAACLVPARRAMRVDPTMAMRYE